MRENCIPLPYTSAAVWFQWRGTPGCPPDTKLCHTRAFCSLQTSLHPTWASRDRPPSLPLYLQPYMIIPHYYPSSARVSRHAKLRSDMFPPVINAPVYCPTLLPAACVELLLPWRWWAPVQVNWKLLSEVSETQQLCWSAESCSFRSHPLPWLLKEFWQPISPDSSHMGCSLSVTDRCTLLILLMNWLPL